MAPVYGLDGHRAAVEQQLAVIANNTKVIIGGLSRWICFLLCLILAAIVATADGGA